MFNKNMFWNHHLKVVFRFVHKINLSIFEIRISLKEKRGNSRENPLQTKKIREGMGSSLGQVKMKLQGTPESRMGSLSAQSGPGKGRAAGGTPLAPSLSFTTPFSWRKSEWEVGVGLIVKLIDFSPLSLCKETAKR